jgi:hypothetical protein
MGLMIANGKKKTFQILMHFNDQTVKARFNDLWTLNGYILRFYD